MIPTVFRLAALVIVAGAVAGSSAGCTGGTVPNAPGCLGGPGNEALELHCAARAVFCIGGPPDIRGECPDGEEVRDPYEREPGIGDGCTGCVLSTGSRVDPAFLCQTRMCYTCLHAFGSNRCRSCEGTVVSVGPAACTLPAMGIPGGPVIGSGGVDAGPPGVDAGPPHHVSSFYVLSIPYAGGNRLDGDPVAEFEIEDSLGHPTAISADELLWVGFDDGHLRGFELPAGEPVAELDLTPITGLGSSVRGLQVYRADGVLMAVVALGTGVARIEITSDTSFVSRGFVPVGFATDARIHPLEPLVDEGYVVAVQALPNVLWVFPRIDATGTIRPRFRELAASPFTPIVVVPEAVGDGFVWAGERTACPGRPFDPDCGRVSTSRTSCPVPEDPSCLTEVAELALPDNPVMGLGGPDQFRSVAAPLVVAVNNATRGVIMTLDPTSLAPLGSDTLDGLISAFTTRSAGTEVFAFATTTASGLGPAELVVTIPTAPSAPTPVASRPLDSAHDVRDIAIGVEAFFPPPDAVEPPEPAEPISLERTDAIIHLLVERP